MKKIIVLRDKIQALDKFHQIEIFKILKTHNVNYTENRNGIFINMNELNKKIIKKIENYLNYVSTQQNQLDVVEQQKEEYKLSFFKDNKDNSYNM
tara:strand:+ start:241 stop:525 length:285 start_codon:yes stop_codon:yes gene_type:complete